MEKALRHKRQRMQLQRVLILALFRLTTQNPRLMFAPTKELVSYLGLEGDIRSVKRRIQQAYGRMEARGILLRSQNEGIWSVSLTAKGERLAEKMDAAERIFIQKPRQWDGKWRIIMFDVWEYRRSVRDQLRRMLMRAGFYKLQDSVWVYPHDCEDLLVFLRTDLKLGKSVLYVIAEGIENDAPLRAHFSV